MARYFKHLAIEAGRTYRMPSAMIVTYFFCLVHTSGCAGISQQKISKRRLSTNIRAYIDFFTIDKQLNKNYKKIFY